MRQAEHRAGRVDRRRVQRAGCLSQEVSDPINARTLAKVEQMGMTMMTICSTCQGVFTQANHRFKSNPEYREQINREYLASEGLEYNGTVEIKHFLWVLGRGVRLGKPEGAGGAAADGTASSSFLRLLSTPPSGVDGAQGLGAAQDGAGEHYRNPGR